MRRALLVAVTAALVLATPFAAGADPVLTVEPSAQTVEYGEAWEYTVAVDDCARSCSTVVIRKAGQTAAVRIDPDAGFSEADFAQEPLVPGSYTFRAYAASTRSPSVNLTVTPAALDVDLRIIADENHPSGAIIIAQLSGAFVERIHAVDCSGCANVGELPTGTWDVAIRDSAGDEVYRQSVTTTTATTTTSENVSMYWQDVPAGEDFTATAEFTPTSQIENFAITAERDIPYTAPESPAVGGITTPDTLPATVQQPSGPTIPLWGILAAIALFMLLVVAAVVLVRIIARSYSRAPNDDDTIVAAETVVAEPAEDEPGATEAATTTPELTEGPRS